MKIAYLTYKSAPHLKDKGQPDCMIAEQKILEDNDKDMIAPWITIDAKDFNKHISDIYSNYEVIVWQDNQPRLVEIAPGIREERDANLKPFPQLQIVSEP
jgi:hypothetical protein